MLQFVARSQRARDGQCRIHTPSVTSCAGLILAALLSTVGQQPLAAQSRSFTYSYSNLFDGELRRQASFSEYEMRLAVEEGLALWASLAPLKFEEVVDVGPPPSGADENYFRNQSADIRIGHHHFDGNTLGHAFPPGDSGLSQDVHLDSSNRTWGETLFFSTVTHEIGHALDLPHIDGVVSLMNEQLGGRNLLSTPGESQLFQPEIDALQQRWSVGQGEVVTYRNWSGSNTSRWTDHDGWSEGWQPSRFSHVHLGVSDRLNVERGNYEVRSLSLGGGNNQLALAPSAHLQIDDDLILGRREGGDPMVAVGDVARVHIPTSDVDEDRWNLPGFDDAAWSVGSTGIGYERNPGAGGFDSEIRTNVESEMFGNNSSIYARLEFDVDDPNDLAFLSLNMKYDDGFVAYLNGTEVASANSPGGSNWNAAAVTSRRDANARQPETYELTDAISALRPGRNVLAIQGLNNRATSSDLLIVPELVGGAIGNEIVVEGGELSVTGDVVLAEDLASRSTVRIQSGLVRVGGNVVRGDGNSRIEIHGGTLQVDGGFESVRVVDQGDVARIHVPTSDAAGKQWQRIEFDDSQWAQGASGFGFERDTGFESLIETDLESQLHNRNGSFYTRFEFDIQSPDDIGELLLNVKYDDGFVAYLNGERIAAANAPTDVQWNSSATRASDEASATRFATFDISSFANLVQEGRNVLAVQGLNSSPSSSDFLLVPQLVSRKLSGTIDVDTLEFSGGQLHGVVQLIGDFELRSGVFSPSKTAGDRIGLLVVDGDYRMTNQSTLRIELGVESDDSLPRDQLRVTGTVELDGGLDLSRVDADTPNQEPGTTERWTLVEAGELVGEFTELTINGSPWEAHQQGGLFWHLETRSNGVTLRSYQAFAGDVDGDQQFNSTDLVSLFRAGLYQDGVPDNSDWTTGDWNGDQDFDSGDLVAAFRTGTYRSSEAVVVPEPNGIALLLVSLLAWRRKLSLEAASESPVSPT